MATELITRLNSHFEVRVHVQELFSYPTIASISTLIDSKLNKDVETPEKLQVSDLNLLAEVDRHDYDVVK